MEQTLCVRVCTVVGAVLYMTVLGAAYIYGSIAPYVGAYYNVSTTKTQLLFPLGVIIHLSAMPIGTRLSEVLRARTMMIIGGTINVSSFLLASIVPRENFAYFALLWLTGTGICNGLTYIVPIKLGWRAFPEHQGLMSGITISGFGLGPLIFISLTTLLVNPDNLS